MGSKCHDIGIVDRGLPETVQKSAVFNNGGQNGVLDCVDPEPSILPVSPKRDPAVVVDRWIINGRKIARDCVDDRG